MGMNNIKLYRLRDGPLSSIGKENSVEKSGFFYTSLDIMKGDIVCFRFNILRKYMNTMKIR